MSTTRHRKQAKLTPTGTLPKRVILVFETWSAAQRNCLEGIGRFVAEQGNWIIRTMPFQFLSAKGLADWRTDGVIVHSMPDRLRLLTALPMPVVDISESGVGRLPCVTFDNERVGEAAAAHLLSRGLAHFAYFGCAAHCWSAPRLRGFLRTLAAQGHTCQAHAGWSIQSASTIRGWAEHDAGLRRWLLRLPRPVGLFAFNDHFASQILETCRTIGLHVPQDVAIVGVDNDPITCDLTYPHITSVAPPFEAIGYRAATLLKDLMAGAPPPAAPIYLPVGGVEARQSSDVLVTEDHALADAIAFLRAHATEPVRIKELLPHLGISRRSLEQRCKRLLGLTPRQELVRIRVERAQQLLVTTALPVAEIARRAGFANATRLAEAFRQNTGNTPSACRRRGRARRDRPL